MGRPMEPVTHLLTGACLGRAGLNRRTAHATLAAVLAAEAADLDVLWGLRGPVEGLAHHRGITHTLVAAPFVALAVTGAVWLWRRVCLRSKPAKASAQPVSWRWIWLTALIADLSHLALDWTNNYGLRPFFPFNRHWYAGSIVFIAEPVLWLLLGLALVIPAVLGLADSEIGARRARFRGRGLAVAALCGMVLLWCWRWAEQAEARNLVEAAQVTPTPALRMALEPYPWNPFRWHAILETATTWQTAEVDTRTGAVDSDPSTNTLYKAAPTPATEAARRTRLGQVYLDWSQWPVVRDVGPMEVAGVSGPRMSASQRWTTVEFSDLRFAYSYKDLKMAGSSEGRLSEALMESPLTGWVYIVDGRDEAAMILDGREQR